MFSYSIFLKFKTGIWVERKQLRDKPLRGDDEDSQKLTMRRSFHVVVVIIIASTIQAMVIIDEKKEDTFPMTIARKSPIRCEEQDSKETRRVKIPSFLSEAEVSWLVGIVERGMATVQDQRGPTIMDPDLGLVLAPGGEVQQVEAAFTEDELAQYGELLKRVHDRTTAIHQVAKSKLYHTAPTFIARLAPFPPPEERVTQHVHDEYWHLHCDKNNTEHYDYSALVYLSEYGKDFEGGVFQFEDEDPVNKGKTKITKVYPEKGTLLTFSSGIENAHRVTPVTKGCRLAWSLWFTCDPEKKFLKSRLKFDHDEEL